VLVKAEHAEPLTSQTYDLDTSEEEVRERWERYYQELGRGEGRVPKSKRPTTNF
jgi:hypothetical protein